MNKKIFEKYREEFPECFTEDGEIVESPILGLVQRFLYGIVVGTIIWIVIYIVVTR